MSFSKLLKGAKEERDIQELASQVEGKQQVDAFLKIFYAVNNGALHQQVVKDTLHALAKQLQDPVRAVRAVTTLGIPTRKYQLFSRLTQQYGL